MKKLKQSLIAAVGLIVLAVVISILISPSTRAQVAEKVKTGIVSVLVVNTPSQPVPVAGTVDVGNLESTTLIVRDIENPARQPVHYWDSCNIPTGAIGCDLAPFDVPATKRLVIEYASFSFSAGANVTGRVATMRVGTRLGGDFALHSISSSNPTAGGGQNDIAVGQQLRIYADPGTQVSMSVLMNTHGTQGSSFSGAFSGYYVDVP